MRGDGGAELGVGWTGEAEVVRVVLCLCVRVYGFLFVLGELGRAVFVFNFRGKSFTKEDVVGKKACMRWREEGRGGVKEKEKEDMFKCKMRDTRMCGF